MEYQKAEKFEAVVVEKYYLNEKKNYLFVKLELENPKAIKFYAGQYVSIRMNEKGERRSYSIVSSPGVPHAISLVAEIIPGGLGSVRLNNIEIGEKIEFLGPLGRFVVEDEAKLLFVATGSGIAPVYSMLNELLQGGDKRPLRLHWGMRSEEDLFWLDNFERLSEEYPQFVYDVVLSRPSSSWRLCEGHVQDCLMRDFEGREREMKDWGAYICGNPGMVTQIRELANKLGIEEEQIHHEKFA